MHIAIIARDYNSRGGVERISQFYARGLRKLGHQITVWCNNCEPTELDNGIEFKSVPALGKQGPFYAFSYALSTTWFVKASNYDCVVSMGSLCLTPDIVVVANSVHRHWFIYSLSRCTKFSTRWWLKLLNPMHPLTIFIETLQYRNNRYRGLIAVSEPTKLELMQNYAIAGDHISVLPNGADWNRLAPNKEIREQIRAKLGIQEKESMVLMLVNELERKGFPQLIEALAKLNDPTIRLVVAGNVDIHPYQQRLNELGLAERVVHVGKTKDPEHYLWAADLYVLPTQYEAWNLSIVEAQTAGLPVVTTVLGQADSMIIDGETGFLIEDPYNTDEIATAIKLWIDSPYKDDMARKSRQNAASYSWDVIVGRLDRMLAELPAIRHQA